jgi:hypothetical protein
MMAQRYPLPITNAMLTPANPHVAKPRYNSPANVAADWHGGEFGNDTDHSEATQAIANSHSANVEIDYDPQHQEAKGKDMVPVLVPLSDLGKDYGVGSGLPYRDGTIEPRQPYPAVKP